MPKIWIVNRSGHRYHLASGAVPEADPEIGQLTEGNVDLTKPDRLLYNISEIIVRETEPEDYLLLTGAPLLNALAAISWFSHHGEMRTLIWLAHEEKYKRAVFDKTGLSNLLAHLRPH